MVGGAARRRDHRAATTATRPGPTRGALWRFMDEQRVTLFGCGAAYLIELHEGRLRAARTCRGSTRLRAINSTGSPLPSSLRLGLRAREARRLAGLDQRRHRHRLRLRRLRADLPVHAGRDPVPRARRGGLGVRRSRAAGRRRSRRAGDHAADAVDAAVLLERPRRHALAGELLRDCSRACWRHGDWIRFTPRGTSVIYGRSDTTINRFGIRMGTAEIYRVVEELPEVRDSLVVDLEYLGRPSFMPLFVVLRAGRVLDDALTATIKSQIRTEASARHVPDEVYADRRGAAHAHRQEDGGAGAQAAARRCRWTRWRVPTRWRIRGAWRSSSSWPAN